jgi:hypothetical protein
LIVTARIFTKDVCTFSSGVVTYINNGKPIVPVATFAAASTISNAQINVDENGGAWGIWNKFDSRSVDFYPDQDEVLGYWNCTQFPSTTISSDMYVYFLFFILMGLKRCL